MFDRIKCLWLAGNALWALTTAPVVRLKSSARVFTLPAPPFACWRTGRGYGLPGLCHSCRSTTHYSPRYESIAATTAFVNELVVVFPPKSGVVTPDVMAFVTARSISTDVSRHALLLVLW